MSIAAIAVSALGALLLGASLYLRLLLLFSVGLALLALGLVILIVCRQHFKIVSLAELQCRFCHIQLETTWAFCHRCGLKIKLPRK